MTEKIIKLFFAILFFICLAHLPYGYYQFVRFSAMVGFAFLSFRSYERGEKSFTVIYAALAILFQPLVKITLGRDVWNIVDVIVGIGLIISIFFNPKKVS